MFILDTVLYWIVYGVIGYCLLLGWSCILIRAVDAWINNITKGDYEDLLETKLKFIEKPFEDLYNKNEFVTAFMFTVGGIFCFIITVASLLRPDKFLPLYEVISIASRWVVENLNVYLYGVIVLVGLHFVFKHAYSFIKRVNTALEKEDK